VVDIFPSLVEELREGAGDSSHNRVIDTGAVLPGSDMDGVEAGSGDGQATPRTHRAIQGASRRSWHPGTCAEFGRGAANPADAAREMSEGTHA
jgi:hypothetical protein